MNDNFNPLISVIINCYNGQNFIKTSVESVLAQTYKNFELIFYDNASTDKTKEIFKSYNDKRLKYYSSNKNVPLGEARNCAIEACGGDYLSFLDVDDVWGQKKLEEQIKIFTDKDIGLVYSQIKRIDSNGNFLNENLTTNNDLIDVVSSIDLFRNYDICLSSAMISTKFLRSENKVFDNNLIYAEEYDLFMRISFLSKVIRINKVLAYYRVHESQQTLKLFERSIFESLYINSRLMIDNSDVFLKNHIVMQKYFKEVAWLFFLNFNLKNKSKVSRLYLRPYIFHSFKYFLIYLVSFFGSRPVLLIWNHYLKGKELPRNQ